MPKTRSAIRKNKAGAAAALFATNDVISVSSEYDADPMQLASASVLNNIVNYRLSRTSHKSGMPWFDIAIDSARAQQKISLPMRAHETGYSATIGNRYQDNSLVPFASSNITHVPPGKVIPDKFKESKIVFGREAQHIWRTTTIPDSFKESEIAFESISQGFTGSREISIYTYEGRK